MNEHLYNQALQQIYQQGLQQQNAIGSGLAWIGGVSNSCHLGMAGSGSSEQDRLLVSLDKKLLLEDCL